jgi:hypothetical protein
MDTTFSGILDPPSRGLLLMRWVTEKRAGPPDEKTVVLRSDQHF